MNAMMKMQLTELVEQIQRDHKKAASTVPERSPRRDAEPDPYREGVRIAQRSAGSFRAALAETN